MSQTTSLVPAQAFQDGNVVSIQELPNAYVSSVAKVRDLAQSGEDLEAEMLTAYRQRLTLAEQLGEDQDSQMTLLVNRPDLRRTLESDLSAREQIQQIQQDPSLRDRVMEDAFGDMQQGPPQDHLAAVGARLRQALTQDKPEAVPTLVGLHADLSENVLQDPFLMATTTRETPSLARAVLVHRLDLDQTPKSHTERMALADQFERAVEMGNLERGPAVLDQARASRQASVEAMLYDPRIAMEVGLRIKHREDAHDMAGATRMEALLWADTAHIGAKSVHAQTVDQSVQRTTKVLSEIHTQMHEELGKQASDPAIGYVWLSRRALNAEGLAGANDAEGQELARSQNYRAESLRQLQKLVQTSPSKLGVRIMEASEILEVAPIEQRDILQVDRKALSASSNTDPVVSGMDTAYTGPMSLWDNAKPTPAPALAEPVSETTGPQVRGGIASTEPLPPRAEDPHIERGTHGYAQFNRTRLGNDGPGSFDLVEPYLATGKSSLDRLIKDEDSLAFALPLDRFGQCCMGNVKQAMSGLMKTEEGREQIRSLLEGTRNMRDKCITHGRATPVDQVNHDRLEMGYRALLNGVRGRYQEDFAGFFSTTTAFLSEEANDHAKLNNQVVHGVMKGRPLEERQSGQSAKQPSVLTTALSQGVTNLLRAKVTTAINVDRH